jgi:hypothetical protein
VAKKWKTVAKSANLLAKKKCIIIVLHVYHIKQFNITCM